MNNVYTRQGREAQQGLMKFMQNVLLMVMMVLLPAGAFGVEEEKAPQAPEYQVSRIFAEISAAAATVKNLTSDFIQEKHLAMLEDTLVANGRFYYVKPDRLRWELIAPERYGFAVSGAKARRWRGQGGFSQTFKTHKVPFIKVFTDQVFAWARVDFDWLKQGYRITVLEEHPVDLRLEPVASQEKAYLDHLRILFAADASHVQMVEVHEKGGDFTRIRFANTVINGPVGEDLF